MREAFAILVLILLISAGWNQSFSSHFASLTGAATSTPRATASPIAANNRSMPGNAIKPTPPDNSWMWRKTKMDQPYNRR